MTDLDKKSLKNFVNRIEDLEMQRRMLAKDIAEVYKEAKGAGFLIGALRKIVSIRVAGINLRNDVFHKIDQYAVALGMV